MKRLIAWFVENPVAANLLMLFIIAAGFAGATRLRHETFPNVAFDMVHVGVEHPGASADEIERSVSVRIEEAIHGIRGVRRLTSTATEGFSSTWVELANGTDARRVLEEVRTRVDAISELPNAAKAPIVQELVDDSVLLAVGIFGSDDLRSLRAVGERLRDELNQLPEVTRAELVGVRPYEIAIELSEPDLVRHGLRFDDVAASVRGGSLDLAGGSLDSPSGEILLRTRAQAQHAADFERLALLTDADGTRLSLGDVATVIDGFARTDEQVWVDGQPAAVVRLLTSERENVLVVAEAVEAHLAGAAAWLPGDVTAKLWYDQVRQFEGRRDLLLRNGWWGLLLILAVLALFLPLALAVWVSFGIPVAFFGALLVCDLAGVSLNMMSMFAFIVALGLVVDDAIIIGENIAREREQDGSAANAANAAIAGAQSVAVPVTIAVATTMLFLLPTLSLPGVIGKISYSLGVVVMGCLFFSLVESLLILPAHLAHARDLGRWRSLPIQPHVDAALRGFIERFYRPALDACLASPALVLSSACVLWLVTVALLSGGWVRSGMIPRVADDYVTARVTLPVSSPPEATLRAVAQLEAAAHALQAEALAAGRGPLFDHLMKAVGDSPNRYNDFQGSGEGPNVGHVHLTLVPDAEREVSSIALEALWRERTGVVHGATDLAYRGSDLVGEAEVYVSLSGTGRPQLRAAAAALRERASALYGVRSVRDSEQGGKQEIELALLPAAEARGLTLAELTRQVRQAFHGEEVQRIQRGRDDVAVVVRYPHAERRALADLREMRVRLPDGAEAPFTSLASVAYGTGPAELTREQRRSQIGVAIRVDATATAASALAERLENELLPELGAEFPGLAWHFFGASQEEAELEDHLRRSWLLALAAAYALLAVTLGSYVQPLLILSAIPFGLVGGVAGHALLGLEYSGFSQVGFVALTGVVINDALVLLHRANEVRADGRSWRDALIQAGVTRFRPILLTSLTTFFGLLPLLFERSAQSEWLAPMAVTLGFGVLSATGITLLLLPTAALCLDGWVQRVAAGGTARNESSLPVQSAS